MGDFNANVSSREANHEEVIEGHATEKGNREKKYIPKFCSLKQSLHN